MLQRCYNTKTTSYPYYGALGVRVCEEWKDSETFLTYCDEVLGVRPDGYTLDRFPNKTGNYEPGNVRWADKQSQTENRTIDYENKNDYRWVSKGKNRFTFVGKFKYRGKWIYCGSFATASEAYDAVLTKRAEYGL